MSCLHSNSVLLAWFFIIGPMHLIPLFCFDDVTRTYIMCHISVLLFTYCCMYLCLGTLFKHVYCLIIILLFIKYIVTLDTYFLYCKQPTRVTICFDGWTNGELLLAITLRITFTKDLHILYIYTYFL
jgi:hypothetical protein